MKERYEINEKLVHSNESLQQSRQQLANIIDFLPDATFVIDSDKKVIFWILYPINITVCFSAEMVFIELASG